MERYTLEQYERVMRGDPEPEEDLTQYVRQADLEETAVRVALANREHAADVRAQRLAGREPDAVVEWATLGLMKAVLVILPVAAIVLWFLYAAVTG